MNEDRFDELLENENLFTAWATEMLDVNRRCNWVKPVSVWENAKAYALQMVGASHPAIKLQRLCNSIFSEWLRPTANNDLWDTKQLEPQLTCACLITMVVGTFMKDNCRFFNDLDTIMKCVEDESIHKVLTNIIERFRMFEMLVNYNYYAEDGIFPYEKDLMAEFLIDGDPFALTTDSSTPSSAEDSQDNIPSNNDADDVHDDNDHDAKLASLQAALEEKDKTIATMQAALEEKDKTIATMQSSLEEKDKAIATMQSDLDFYEAGPIVVIPHEKVQMEVLCRMLENAGADFKVYGRQASAARLLHYLTGIKLQTLKNYLSQRNLNINIHPEEVKRVNTELTLLNIPTLSETEAKSK